MEKLKSTCLAVAMVSTAAGVDQIQAENESPVQAVVDTCNMQNITARYIEQAPYDHLREAMDAVTNLVRLKITSDDTEFIFLPRMRWSGSMDPSHQMKMLDLKSERE
jgi:hypothetical protein